jgi:hypothetical protein
MHIVWISTWELIWEGIENCMALIALMTSYLILLAASQFGIENFEI